MTSDQDEPHPEPRSNTALKERYPRIDDPIEAINFALDHAGGGSLFEMHDFLDTWRDGGWAEIEQAYPEFLEQVDGK